MDDVTSDSPGVAPGLSRVGGTVAGRYQVRARLGRGATKEVYLAYDERLDREVALAIVVGATSSQSARARLKREAQVTGRLGDHPNIITVYDTGEHEGVLYLVLRAMRGGSLAELIERDPPSLDEAIRLGGEIAQALAHAHAHGVVHRDVKPDNVWLAADGAAALGDFGISHQLGGERLTAEGVVVGTPRYLSPEQIRGGEVGGAADLYALGVTLYELVAGRPPFTGADATSVLVQHLTATPVPPSRHGRAVPAALERLILALLAKEPGQRPATADVVVDVLAAMRPSTGTRSPASPPTARPDARRLVTVLAVRADIDDPEALHGAFDRCGGVIERHGGAVERYLGDTLVGLFGLTESHGDDAMRAATTAAALRDTSPELRLGLETGGVFLAARAGGAAIATGAAITTAARLAERAEPGAILLGERIRGALGADARVEQETGCLIELQVERPALLRARSTPFVGRAAELAQLHAALARVRQQRACHVVTIVGPPGIGKSRLAGEFLTAAGDDAAVLAGRCLAYGEGTTYQALADIVRALGGDPRRRIEELLADEPQAVRGILGAVGLSDEPVQAQETAWALRRLLERLAAERPLVVAIEDIHWAEPALLDLLDQLAALSTGSPILLLCLARPELLESRPAWAAPRTNRSLLVLDALGGAAAVELAERLGATDRAARIAERAEGNPLFVEQLVAVDHGQDTDELPVSIQAALAARIDRLDPNERLLVQRAAVEGRTFHGGALAALLPERSRRDVGPLLVALARKGLIGAEAPELAGESAFRFTHALIREAAYAGLPKLLRGDLHEGLAAWLGERPGAADEIVGFHLEQACLLAAELGRGGERERALARRATHRFEAASRTAMGRRDPTAATALLERALTVARTDEAARLELLPALGASLFEAGRMTEATRVLDEAIARAPDGQVRARAQIEREFVRLETETIGTELPRLVVNDVLPVLERAGDEHGQCRAWSLRAYVAWNEGQVNSADDAWSEAAACARRAEDERELFEMLAWRATAAVLGPTPVDEAIRRCEAFRALVSASPVAVAWMINPLASLHAMRGDFETAERLVGEANEILEQLSSLSSSVSHHEALVRLLAGEPDRAEASLRMGIERLASMNDPNALATTMAMLAQAVYAQGRLREAEDLCRESAAAAAAEDMVTQAIWRGVQAKVLARNGSCEQAESLARAAVTLLAATDLQSHHGDAMLDLAEVLCQCSQGDESDRVLRAGLDLYELKGNVAAAGRARALLEHRHRG